MDGWSHVHTALGGVMAMIYHVFTLLRGRPFRRVFFAGLEAHSKSYNAAQRLFSKNTHPRNCL